MKKGTGRFFFFPPEKGGGKSSLSPFLTWGLLCALFIQVIFITVFRIFDPDTWWHLKTGEIIVKNMSIPRHDIYSYAIEGRPWVTFEWLSQVLLYLAFSIAGASSLTLFKGIVVAVTMVVLCSLSGNAIAGFCVMGITALCTRGFFFERPQIFDFLLLAVFLKLITQSPNRPAARPPDRRLLWQVPLMQALWVNLHGGAGLIGVGIVGLKFVETILYGRRKENMKFWGLLVVLAAAGMFVNPHGYRIFSHLCETLAFPAGSLIQEWRRPESFLNFHGFLLLLSAASVAISLRRDFVLCGVAVAMGILSLTAVRHIGLFLLAGSGLVAVTLGRLIPTGAVTPKKALAAVLVVGVFSWVSLGRFFKFNRHLFGFGLLELPEGAVGFLDGNNIRGRMFNEYGMGGYLIWKTYPRRQVFVDGRSLEYGPEFVKKAVNWHRPETWRDLEREYGFDYAIVENGGRYTCWLLDADPDWALAYWDDAALVYLKGTPGNEPLIERFRYRYLQPNHISYGYLNKHLYDPARTSGVLKEIDRAIKASPRCANAYQMKAYVLEVIGRREEALGALLTAEKLFPHKAGTQMSLGWYYERGREWEKAAGAYEKALKNALREGDEISASVICNNLGVVHFNRGMRDEAARYLRRCLDLNPGYTEARRNLRKMGFD